MKKLILSLLFCSLLVALPLPAQHFGLKAGLNIAGLQGDYPIELKSLSGFRFGGFFTLDLGGGLQIQPEAYYAQKGASYESSSSIYGIAYSIKGKLKLDYIEIPVLVKYVVQSASVEPFFYAGPYLGLKASAKGEVTADVEGFGGQTETEDLEDVKSTDFGVVFGAGVSLPLGSIDLIVDGRYTLGLSSISEDLTESVKNGVLSILVGIGF